MKLDHLKEKKELVATAMLVVAVVSAVLITVRVRGFFVTSANAQSAVEQTIDQNKPDPKNVTAQSGKFKKVADALKKQNLFSPPPPRQNPVNAVMGIFGDEALINGKWYKVGDKVADAKIVAVAPTAVTVEWDGKKKVFNPIDGGSSSGPGGSSRPGRPTPSSSGGGRPGMVVTQGPRPGGGGGGMPGMEGMTRERMENMSEAERNKFRDQMRQRFEHMSEGERDRFRSEMRQRMGGDRGGGVDRGERGGGPGGGRVERR
jgi:hypothetical protein